MFKLSTVLIAAVAIAVSFAAVVTWRFAFFILPFSWTGESARLAELLRVQPGAAVADIGAGDGAMAAEMARLVGASGVIYATELSAPQRAAIAKRAQGAALSQVRVIQSATDATRLPEACCDAIYLRAVMHHLTDREQFAGEIHKAVRPGGRVVVIDFAPGALWFHGADHGVTREAVRAAFDKAGFRVVGQINDWGGGMFAVVFERLT